MNQGLDVKHWESVLPNALYSLRSLLSTATNCTPHERFFSFPRRSPSGNSLPSWLVPGPVLLRKFVRSSKHDNLVDQVELIDVNPMFANIRYPDGRESSVALKDLAPCPSAGDQQSDFEDQNAIGSRNSVVPPSSADDCSEDICQPGGSEVRLPVSEVDESTPPRKSSRIRRAPSKFEDFVLQG